MALVVRHDETPFDALHLYGKFLSAANPKVHSPLRRPRRAGHRTLYKSFGQTCRPRVVLSSLFRPRNVLGRACHRL